MPVPDGHGPLLGRCFDSQVHHLQGRGIVRKDLPVLDSLADHAIQRFDGVGGVDHLADIIRVIEQRDEIRPVLTPGNSGDIILN